MVICKIADLIVQIPEMGAYAPIFGDYLYKGSGTPEIIITENAFRPDYYPNDFPREMFVFLETARIFFSRLLLNNGFYLHSSSVELDGRAYMFSAKSGVGKSTHTGIWKKTFGDKVCIFNDDKAPLRLLDGKWYAYGAPWCGKNNISQNMKVPVAGICFLEQASENRIRRLNHREAIQKILEQTLYKFSSEKQVETLLGFIEKLVRDIPIFELENKPEPEAGLLSYETMKKAAEEIGL